MFYTCDKLMTHFSVILTAFLLFHFVCSPPTAITVEATPADEAVGKWATQFGDELWELAQRMTKSQEIKAKYKEYNARVELKNGTELIKSITANLGRMLSRKMEAVRCIMQEAESVYADYEFNKTEANEFKYYSSKYSKLDGENRTEEILDSVRNNENMYLNFTLNPDTHFYNISVDTKHSSVHVPSNVYDKSDEILETLMWSEELDKVFVQNYQSDPALSWQYFGSDTGILRHYPALQWGYDEDVGDTYDCRKRSWYIETATCSKDVVILLDNSGSMTGFRNHVAKFTIRSILDTFSNNDFFTILFYSSTVNETIDCFKDVLVQATPENINVFNEAIEQLDQEGYANLTIAYNKAFELLKKYYVKRRCNETCTCNQAIMLVTDGVAGNTTEVFEKYNWGLGENGTTNMSVRVFTYLLGKEVTKVREIQWMACLNRGYYSHVQTLDEVHEEVLKYVDVIATPLVLQDEMHPPTWTHAFTDLTFKWTVNSTEARLMIAVGVPAFDRSYLKPNSTKRARLLGVAGTDVPVEDIDKLTLPYKLGVNGYSFVVSNNGYVLLHPDLRPISSGHINPNYNSIDFTEVEHLYEEIEPRKPGQSLLDIRNAMVRHESSEFKDLSVKFHYDKMRRASEEKQDYFVAPLPNTPFSLGIVLPSDYGKTWIKVGEEVLKNKHMKVNISEFFVGENWKVHPNWVYCKYHYLEGHEFKTPEDELRHFLTKMLENDWKWLEQYLEEESDRDDIDDLNCGRKTQDNDAYYCNKELVHLLIFDAKVTNSSYGEWKFTSEEERNLIASFNATLRFVATMSGLTRWQFIYGEVEVDTDREFGDYHTTAIDETWYKSAILQHHKERSESFVYSVKHTSDPAEDSELKVIASHAIFPRDGGKEAPACVVGFQFSHASMWSRFDAITSKDNCNGCMYNCRNDEIECYVIDNNAYIILSTNDSGKFFGEAQADVMHAMVEINIFQRIEVYDYQALCEEKSLKSSDSTSLLHPLRLLSFAWKWLVSKLFWQWTRIQWWVEGSPFIEYNDVIEDDYTASDQMTGQQPTLPKEMLNKYGEVIFNEPPPEPKFLACDKRSTLYALVSKSLDSITAQIALPNLRPFYVKKIPNSNLLLVIVDVMAQSQNAPFKTEPEKIDYNDTLSACYKLHMNDYERRRIEECYTEHSQEAQYTYCGDASTVGLNAINIAVTTFIFILTRYLRE